MHLDDLLAELRILTVKQVAAATGYSEQHIYRLERAGNFPRLRRLGGNRVGFLYSEVKAWILGRPFAARPSEELSDLPIPVRPVHPPEDSDTPAKPA